MEAGTNLCMISKQSRLRT